MDRAEFDLFADEYASIHRRNISISGERPEYFADYKIRDLATVYSQLGRPAKAPAVLDFGAGVGTSVPFWRAHLPDARITCVDVSLKSLQVGSSKFCGAAGFVLFDGRELPFAAETFDVSFAACVFHHIDSREHVRLLRELFRVVKPGGIVLVYEHNPYNPVTRHAVNTCPFDANAHLITASRMGRNFVAAGLSRPIVRFRVFFPQFLRRIRRLEQHLTWLPLGAQYYVTARK